MREKKKARRGIGVKHPAPLVEGRRKLLTHAAQKGLLEDDMPKRRRQGVRTQKAMSFTLSRAACSLSL